MARSLMLSISFLLTPLFLDLPCSFDALIFSAELSIVEKLAARPISVLGVPGDHPDLSTDNSVFLRPGEAVDAPE